MVLADRRVGALTEEGHPFLPTVQQLQDRYRGSELIRILVSSAVTLRALFDQHPPTFGFLAKKDCGALWPRWPEQRPKSEVLNLREACNKIIHAVDFVDDLVIPSRKSNPDEVGSYIRPFLYLHGTKNSESWRAKLSIIDFARHGAVAFLYSTRQD